ncbi:hypothetical protein ABZP36_006300 [Zizania latifolia]
MARCSLLPVLATVLLARAAASAAAVAMDKLLPAATAVLSFEEGYTQLFGDSNLVLHDDRRRVHISLDERTGAGFASQGAYLHRLFSASIKLPSSYVVGVVVAFYMSNGDVYKRTHDELDFECLGNMRGREWRVQTNVYDNGSTAAGREERCTASGSTPPWTSTATPSSGVMAESCKIIDTTPAALLHTDYHCLHVGASSDYIIFYVDETPIREVVRTTSMGAVPVQAHVDVRHHLGRLDLGHLGGPVQGELQRSAMERFRARYMTYGYCYDRVRYPAPLLQCSVGAEAEAFLPSGDARSADWRIRHGKRRRRSSGDADSAL